jgi:hypothetical protein
LGLPWPSHLFRSVPDAKVDDVREGSRGCCSLMLALLSC